MENSTKIICEKTIKSNVNSLNFYDYIKINEDTIIAILDISNDIKTIKNKINEYISIENLHLNDLKNENRKKEILGSNLLIKALTKKDCFIKHKNNGMPYLTNNKKLLNISVSHTKDFVAVCLSKNKVGIDIEKHGEKAFSVAKKFLTDNEYNMFKTWTENANTLECATIIWSAKEALYKLTQAMNINVGINFMKNFECNIKDISTLKNNSLKFWTKNQINDFSINVNYKIYPKFYLTYCIENTKSEEDEP